MQQQKERKPLALPTCKLKDICLLEGCKESLALDLESGYKPDFCKYAHYLEYLKGLQTCTYPGCPLAPYVEANGQAYDYCGRRHAAKAVALEKDTEVRNLSASLTSALHASTFKVQEVSNLSDKNLLKLLYDKVNKSLKVLPEVDVWLQNPRSLPGFEEAIESCAPKGRVEKAFISPAAQLKSAKQGCKRKLRGSGGSEGRWKPTSTVVDIEFEHGKGIKKYYTKHIQHTTEPAAASDWTMHELSLKGDPKFVVCKIIYKRRPLSPPMEIDPIVRVNPPLPVEQVDSDVGVDPPMEDDLDEFLRTCLS